MNQSTKCFFGNHTFEIKDELHVLDKDNETDIGINYVSRCKCCGKIKSTFVTTNEKYLECNSRLIPSK